MNRKQRRAPRSGSGASVPATRDVVGRMFDQALAYHRDGHLAQAERLYRQILAMDPRHADSLNLLGVLAAMAGQHAVAVDLLRQAIAIDGRIAGYHVNLGTALKAQGTLTEAADCFRRAIALDAGGFDAHYNLANTLRELGQLEEAILRYRQAIDLRPEIPEAHNNLGGVLKELGYFDEAATCFRRALDRKPAYTIALNNLGAVLRVLGQAPEAVAHYRRAIELNPDYADVYANLGLALYEVGKVAEALTAYRRCLVVDPDHGLARCGEAGAVLPVVADTAAASQEAVERYSQKLAELEHWARRHPQSAGKAVRQHYPFYPFYLGYRPGNLRPLLSRLGDLAAATAGSAADRCPAQPIRDGRIRLGIVSAHVRRHSVWDVNVQGLVDQLDRTRFELAIYHTSALADDETAWAESRADRFVRGPLPIEAWSRLIEDDSPDVLFYPEVGMDGPTYSLAVRRLAPLQATTWGSPLTSGLPNIDLFFTGEALEGPTADDHYRERLIRLPGTGVCTRPIPVSAEPPGFPELEEEAGPRPVRFVVCQALYKFEPAHDRLLAEIAKRAQPCEIWLVDLFRYPWAGRKLFDRLAAAFRAEGLDAQTCLRMIPMLPRAKFHGLLDRMDVYLDCPAFSGYTTAWQAVRRGLPVVTLEGEFLRQRLAAGLLRQIGRTGTIATTPEDYVSVAVRMAEDCRDPAARAHTRDLLRTAAPLADGRTEVVRAFEAHLIDALSRRPGR